MIYGYIRVSTDKQTVENQRFEIEKFCEEKKLVVNQWVNETISDTRDIDERALGSLLVNLRRNDILICSELSRLGRSFFMIMDVLSKCMTKGAQLWTIKDNYRLGSDISSKVLAFAFAISAEIERNLISQRTKEALARVKSEGISLGRPKGSKSHQYKLEGKERIVAKMISRGYSQNKMAKELHVSRCTVDNYLRRNGLKEQ